VHGRGWDWLVVHEAGRADGVGEEQSIGHGGDRGGRVPPPWRARRSGSGGDYSGGGRGVNASRAM
jgi:hypothetical protein